MSPNIRRKIVTVEKHMNPGWQKHWAVGGRYWFILECGHTHRRKISDGIPKTMIVRCDDCIHLAKGGGTTRGNIRQTWDPEKQWPIFTEVT